MDDVQSKNKNDEIKIRLLTVADRKRLSSLIKRLTSTTGDDSFVTMISSAITARAEAKDSKDKEIISGKTTTAIQVGLKIIQLLLEFLEEETHTWFADLVNVEKEEFLKLPIDTEMIILEQMVTSEESSNFFTIASRLYSKIGAFQERFSGAKTE